VTRAQEEFVDYLLSFYGEGGIYTTKAVDPFGDRPMSRDEAAAVTRTLASERTFEGDSFDREKARDLVLEGRLRA
jgi:hypothetical protein